MKKQILNLGKALNKAEQKEINGGNMMCYEDSDCIRNCIYNPFEHNHGYKCIGGSCLYVHCE